MKKLKNNRGETLVETLVSILIVVLTFVFLITAAVSAAKINAAIKETDTSFRYSAAELHGKAELTLTGRGTLSGEKEIQIYTQNGYAYYAAAQGGS